MSESYDSSARLGHPVRSPDAAGLAVPQRGVALSQLARGIVVVADAAAAKTEVNDSDLSAFLAHLTHPEPPSGGTMNDDTGPKA